MMTTDPDLAVSRRARGQIAEAGKRQADVAVALDMSQPSLSRRLSGARSFTIGELHALAAYLEVPVERLLGEASAATAVPA